MNYTILVPLVWFIAGFSIATSCIVNYNSPYSLLDPIMYNESDRLSVQRARFNEALLERYEKDLSNVKGSKAMYESTMGVGQRNIMADRIFHLEHLVDLARQDAVGYRGDLK